MSGKPILFSGPSLGNVKKPEDMAIDIRPPCRQGDVYLATLSRPRAIGIVDGYFEGEPSVWHKEILYALSTGIHVLGASSMGALRAAELDSFGMVGIGKIYQAYRDEEIEDDDEVALLHGPVELDSPPLSVPMVNVRATLESAATSGVLSTETAIQLTSYAKDIYYKQRTWDSILEVLRNTDVETRTIETLKEWLPTGEIDQKALDAMELLGELTSGSFSTPFNADFEFEVTEFWFQSTKVWEQSAREIQAEMTEGSYRLFS